MATSDRTRAQRRELLEAQIQRAAQAADPDRLRRVEEEARAEAQRMVSELWEDTDTFQDGRPGCTSGPAPARGPA